MKIISQILKKKNTKKQVREMLKQGLKDEMIIKITKIKKEKLEKLKEKI